MVVLYMARECENPTAPDTLAWEDRFYKGSAWALVRLYRASLLWGKWPARSRCYDPRRNPLPWGLDAPAL